MLAVLFFLLLVNFMWSFHRHMINMRVSYSWFDLIWFHNKCVSNMYQFVWKWFSSNRVNAIYSSYQLASVMCPLKVHPTRTNGGREQDSISQVVTCSPMICHSLTQRHVHYRFDLFLMWKSSFRIVSNKKKDFCHHFDINCTRERKLNLLRRKHRIMHW